MSVRYCGRTFTPEQIERLRTLIEEDPKRTRADLSRLACREFNWLKADGGLKEMSARVAMLRMHEDGLIELPPPRCKRPEARIRIGRQTEPGQPIHLPARALSPLSWQQVQKRSASRLWNEYTRRIWVFGKARCVSRAREQGVVTSNSLHYCEEPQRSYRVREACIAAENPCVTGIYPALPLPRL